jgi:hypothetical protein
MPFAAGDIAVVMSDQHDPNEGVSAWQAMERWTPKELWQRYKQIAVNDTYQMFILGPGVPLDLQHQEASDLRAPITKILIKQLMTGELVASGIESPPRNVNNPRQDVAADLWPLLDLNLFNSEARGDRLKIVALKIRSGAHVDTPGSALKDHGEVAPDAHPEERSGLSRRGPKTIMPVIEAELLARARGGELLPTLAAESRHLETWAKKSHPNFSRPPTAKSIREALQSSYNRMKN